MCIQMVTVRGQQIMRIVHNAQPVSISAIHELLIGTISRPTLNRDLLQLTKAGWLHRSGVGKATRYVVAERYMLFGPINVQEYFAQDPDVRNGNGTYNFELQALLRDHELFSAEEKGQLRQAQLEYQANIVNIPAVLYRKELQRLTIELSWKSAQIEGNTYSLLETERLFAEQQEAKGKTRAEAIMLMNHKRVFEHILEHGLLAGRLSLGYIESIHALLMDDLEVGRNIRTRGVGITGSVYKPLDNDHQIREQMGTLCELINDTRGGYEKALIAILLISYIQPFEDGNKRTARMIGNALLIHHEACPLSYRSVDPIYYKEATLLFYEQNNLNAFKAVFMEQVQFAVKNYFR